MTFEQAPISDPRSFWLEARHQGACAICGATGLFHAHHVLFRKWLKQRRLPLYDTRNARRLCPKDNLNFEVAMVEFPLTKLLDVNLEYAFEVMGPAAYDWLHSHYAGDDARVEVMLGGVPC